MAISETPPKGGIIADIGGRSRPLLLRNVEIERFEKQHDVGIFQILDSFLARTDRPKAHQVRDLVALALVGGGMMDRAADDIVTALPPSENMRLLSIASDALLIAFMPEKPQKKA